MLEERLEKEIISNFMAYLVVKLVNSSSDASYGYQIKKNLETLLNRTVPEGTLYPLLTKLADPNKYGYLESRISNEEQGGRTRRYYYLTPKGHEILKKWPKKWMELCNFINETLKTLEEKNDKSII